MFVHTASEFEADVEGCGGVLLESGDVIGWLFHFSVCRIYVPPEDMVCINMLIFFQV